jgi:hypothetical protein
MNMNKNIVLIGILVFAFFTIGVMNNRQSQIQESITYFPIDPKVTYTSTNTSIHFQKPQKSDKYLLKWQIESTLDRKAYLRQDIGFLFSNGRLIAKQGYWKQNTDHLIQEREIVGRESALVQALSFHYAELHENDEKIFSSQKMSADQIYIANLQNQAFHSFRNAFSKQEQEWKQKLDQHTKEFLYHSWEKGIRSFSINPEQYVSFPLTDLFLNPSSSFPGFTEQETNQIIGNLWEGLYKNYFLGIKKADGTRVKPIGSTIPLILIAKDKSHLLVLTETANGEPTLLRQMIGYGH